MNYFNPTVFSRLKEATRVSHTGVRHGFCDEVFLPEVYEQLMKDFPNPQLYLHFDKKNSGGGHKRFYAEPGFIAEKHGDSAYHLRHLPAVWKNLLNEVSSPDFLKTLSDAIGVETNSICSLGFAYGEKGSIMEAHIDGAIREGTLLRMKSNVAFLLYFNENSDPVSATELYDLDRKTILAKGTTMRNSWFFFEQHPNSWHGFPEVVGNHTRRVVSLSFSIVEHPIIPQWSFLSRVKLLIRNFFYRIHKRYQVSHK